jgi:multisubunit Na+/H+ antiporter MnhB subunit
MFINMVTMHMVQTSIMQVINVITMLDGFMTTIRSMLVAMFVVCLTVHSKNSPGLGKQSFSLPIYCTF